MTDNIEETADNLRIASDFREKWGKLAPGTLTIGQHAVHLFVYRSDCAQAGKVFGRVGWTRKMSYSKAFDWHREIDGVHITILNAEEMSLEDTPVPPSQFPLQLEETAAVEESFDSY